MVVLLGNGDGTFGSPMSYSIGAAAHGAGVVLADFTGDGNLDVATANFDNNNVSVLLGNGDGSFQSGQTYGVGNYPGYLASGDFTGDGFPDLVTVNYYSNDVSILLNDGNWLGGGGAPGGAHFRRGLPRPRTPSASPGLLAERLLRLDTSAAPLPPPGTPVPLGDGSRPFLRSDSDIGSTRAALAAMSATQFTPPAQVGTRVLTPARALLDRLFVNPESRWLWDRSADEPWLAGP